MPSERELVRGIFETFNASGGESVLDYLRDHDALAPEFGARVQPDAPNGGDWPGVDGYQRMVETWMEVWDDFKVVPREYEDLEDGRWLVPVTQSATSTGGAVIEAAFFYTLLLDDGKLARLGIWNDEARARADFDAPGP